MEHKKTLSIPALATAIILVILFGAVILGVVRKDNASGKDKEIKIGLLLAQTGFGADFGQSEKSIIPLLRQKYGEKVLFVLEDNKSDAAKGVIAAQKLLNIDKVDMIYCDLTSVANAISPMLKNSQKILMAAVYLEQLTKDNPFAIRSIPNAKDECELLFHFFSEKHPGGKILLLGSNDEFGRGAVSVSKSLLSEFGVESAGTDTIPEDLSHIASLAEKIVSNAPDGVYIGSMNTSMGILVKELRTRGYKGSILTTDAFSYDYVLNAAGEAAASVVYVDFPKTEAYRAIERELDGHNVTPATILMYDGIRLYLDKIVPELRSKPDVKLEDLTCQMDGVFGETKLVRQEIKYKLVLVNANKQGT